MGRSSNSPSPSGAARAAGVPRLFCIRVTLFLLALSISLISVYFSYQVTTLASQVQSDNAIILSLQNQVNGQKSIIDRFNTSITNADVEHQVQALELSLHQTEDNMKQSLATTTEGIQHLLNDTVAKLDGTVRVAQQEIQYEVELVKSDVQQYVRTTQDQFSMENSFMKFQLAGTFCLLAILISMWHMTAHIRQFKRPFVQRKILAILWMSPIYSVTSWLSLVFPKFEGYLAIVKDFYEAYVIYQFLGFCISVLGRGDRNEVVTLLASHTDHLDPPMRMFGWCRKPYTYPNTRVLADAVLMQCQVFAMQFVFLQPLTAVGLFTCHQYPDVCTFGNEDDSLHLFGKDIPIHKTVENPMFWLRIIQNISVFMAFSGLLKFYHAVQDDLEWCRPFPKFLCIKGIVFMTFWQGLVISFLATTTNIDNGGVSGTSSAGTNAGTDDNGDNDPDMWGKQAQNFLICLEMLLFSIAHFYCFPTEEWEDGYRPSMEKKLKGGFSDNVAFGDFVADLKLILRGSQKKPKNSKQKSDSDLTLKIGDDNGNDDNDNDKKDNGGLDVERGFDIEKEGNTKEEKKGMNDSLNDDFDDRDGDDANNNSSEKNNDEEQENEVDDNDDLNLSNDDSLDDETMNNFLTTSIRHSLGDDSAEVREAAHRLLRNRMVDVDRLSEGSRSRGSNLGSNSNSNHSDLGGNNDNDGLGFASADTAYGAIAVGEKNVLEYNAMTPMGGGLEATSLSNVNPDDDDGDNLVGETTSLLGNRTSVDSSKEGSMGALNNFG